MDLSEKFDEAQNRVNSLTQKPSSQELLQLYAYYKQATVGDILQERPGGFDLKGAAKFDAWSGVKGMTPEASMEAYIKLVEELETKY